MTKSCTDCKMQIILVVPPIASSSMILCSRCSKRLAGMTDEAQRIYLEELSVR